jgi:hypothetical protein
LSSFSTTSKKTASKNAEALGQCFVVSPIGPRGSAVRKHANELYNKIITPALTNSGYGPHRIDHISPQGEITQAIIQQLATAPLCIVVLTDLNPNVMYELGLRQAWCLPYISLAAEGTELPFDIQNRNAIFYSLKTREGVTDAVARLETQVKNFPCITGSDAVFQEVMSNIGDRYSLNAVFKAKERALIVLCDRIQDIKGEIEDDFELDKDKPKPDSLAQFVDPISSAFRKLRIQVLTLEWIANAQLNTTAPRAGCLDIIGRIKEIQKLGVPLRESLVSGKCTRQVVRDVVSQLDKILLKARQAQQLCDPHKHAC